MLTYKSKRGQSFRRLVLARARTRCGESLNKSRRSDIARNENGLIIIKITIIILEFRNAAVAQAVIIYRPTSVNNNNTLPAAKTY